MVFSNTFHELSGRLHKFIIHASTHSFKPVGAPLFIALLCLLGGMTYGCGGGDSSDSSDTGPTAIFTAKESSYVPGRMELDGTLSTAWEEKSLVSHTLTVKHLDTGQIVFGPVTILDNPDSGPVKDYPKFDTQPAPTAAGVDERSPDIASVSGDYVATLTVEDDAGRKDTTESIFSLEADVVYAESDSCSATCSVAPSEPDQVVCTLTSACHNVDLVDEVMDQATNLNSTIDEATTTWMQARGASGGNGTDNSVGGGSGTGGIGGFAQMITSISDYEGKFGHSQIYYYLGKVGSHDDSGGSGGASTMVLDVEPDGSLNENQIVLIAGGGGGGSEGSAFYSGSKKGGTGGAGGFAYADQIGVSATGKSTSAPYDGVPQEAPYIQGHGGGETGCSEGVACGGGGYNAGHQGFGGKSGGSGSSPGPKGWTNGTPDLANDAGHGGKGHNAGTCDGGGGGGGFGGGGGATMGYNDDQDWYRCYGGGGGGSYAAASTTTDGDAPTTDEGTGGNGEVIIVFNADAFFGTLPEVCQCLNSNGAVESCGELTEAVRCFYDKTTGSQLGLDLASLRTEINMRLAEGGSGLEIGFFTSPVVVESWGGVGGRGADDYFIFKLCSGGSGGERGYARTTLLYSDLDAQGIDSKFYLYVAREGPNSDNYGGKGAPSSIVIGQPLEDQIAPAWDPNNDRVIVVAGGSGGGSACGGGVGGSDGRGGGYGGCVTSLGKEENCRNWDSYLNRTHAYAMGGNGGGGDHGGGGGSARGFGLSGIGGDWNSDYQGNSGVGGFGGRNYWDSGWIGWENCNLKYTDCSYGAGGMGDYSSTTHAAGGGGGGGFGGGGGGAVSSNAKSWGGGGGGGSWARLATGDESSVPFVGRNGLGDLVSGRAGAIALNFGLVARPSD